MLNSENAGIINSSSYYINANSSSENFSVSKSPAGFFFFLFYFICFVLFYIVETKGILSTIITLR